MIMIYKSNQFLLMAIVGESKQYSDGHSPLDYLEKASFCYASAIKIKPKDPALHLQLGKILEERYYAEDLFGQKKEVRHLNRSSWWALCQGGLCPGAFVLDLFFPL